MDFQAYDVAMACAREGGLDWRAVECVAERRGAVGRSAREGDEEKIDALWRERIEANPKLFNGTKFRFAGCAVGTSGGTAAERAVAARVTLGLTDYKTFLATNLSEDWRDFIEDDDADGSFGTMTSSTCGRASVREEGSRYARFANALGNCVCLRSADDYFFALQRSDDVGEAPGALVFPGGHGEPSELGLDVDDENAPRSMDVSRYVFDNALAELGEELGVHPSDVTDVRILGITRRVINARPCMVFYARTPLTSEEIITSRYPLAADGYESNAAVALRVDDFDRSRMPGDHVGALSLLIRALEHENLVTRA